MTEETDWVGGQFTAQGLDASDEHRSIDTVGATRSFAQLRSTMRAAYGGKKDPAAGRQDSEIDVRRRRRDDPRTTSAGA